MPRYFTSSPTDRGDSVITQALTARATSYRFDLVTMLLSVWMVGGVFVDGWAHINLASTKETFFTPWHAVLYSGFTAVATWLILPVARARNNELLRRVPIGYGLAFGGLVLFAAGGAGDALWHTLFGIEVGIDALLSPTHILLLVGGLLVLTSPVRAAWQTVNEAAPALRSLMPAVLSMALTAALVAFFFAYAWGAFDTSPASAVPAPALDENAAGHLQAERAIAFGILARLVTTVVLLGPLLYLARRWQLPAGVFSIVFATVSMLVFALSEAPVALLVAPLAAGAVADTVLWRFHASPDDVWVLRSLAAGTAFVLWAVHFAALALVEGLGWLPELWGGAIAMAVLAAFGIAVLAAPAPIPAPTGATR